MTARAITTIAMATTRVTTKATKIVTTPSEVNLEHSNITRNDEKNYNDSGNNGNIDIDKNNRDHDDEI